MPNFKEDFEICINDLMSNEDVLAMSRRKQHLNVTCLEHGHAVGYISYRICRAMGWDAVAAARGGLLHDMFLYNQYEKGRSLGVHLVTHPKVAFENASKVCSLSKVEKDIILKHMWPLTLQKPKYKEAYVVNAVDKICAICEATLSILTAIVQRKRCCKPISVFR